MIEIGEHIPNDRASVMYDRFRSYIAVEENVGAFFRRDFLAARGWRAAVVSEELSSAEAHKLASTCRRAGFRKAWALDVNNFDSRSFYSILLEISALTMLEETFLTPSYLLVEENEQFTLVSDGDYYWEIAGSQAFLEGVFEKSLETVDREFRDATRNYRRGASRIGRLLQRIAAEAIANPASAD